MLYCQFSLLLRCTTACSLRKSSFINKKFKEMSSTHTRAIARTHADINNYINYMLSNSQTPLKCSFADRVLHATLRYATLRYATLRYATLRYATLRYATLRYATLRYATLRYATLRLCIIYRSRIIRQTIVEGSLASGDNVLVWRVV